VEPGKFKIGMNDVLLDVRNVVGDVCGAVAESVVIGVGENRLFIW
jgi:hypothetical protein